MPKKIPMMFTTLDFGVENVLQMVHQDDGGLLGKLLEAASFTVEEARERISDLLTGGFVPDSMADLRAFLRDRFLKLETRIAATKAVNYLVDLKTGGEVPAAQVDPRLKHENLLKQKLREALRRQLGDDMRFGTWQGLLFGMDDHAGGMALTVEGYNSWYGRVFDTASDSAEANRLIIERARKQGVDLIYPTKDLGSDELVAGMPILRRHQSALAADLNPDLDHEALSTRFGKSMYQAFEEMAGAFEGQHNRAASVAFLRRSPVDVSDESLTVAAFRAQFMKKPGQGEDFGLSRPTPSLDDGFDFAPAPEPEPRMERAARAAPSVVYAPRPGYMP